MLDPISESAADTLFISLGKESIKSREVMPGAGVVEECDIIFHLFPEGQPSGYNGGKTVFLHLRLGVISTPVILFFCY